MIAIRCCYSALSELSADANLDVYHQCVRPLDYDFCLDRGKDYLFFGIIWRCEAPWLYVTSMDNSPEVDIVPAVLFPFDCSVTPTGMSVKMTNFPNPQLEILPTAVASIDNWFERYIDEDDEVMEIVKSEINRLRGN